MSTNLRRVFLERGLDFFEAEKGASRESQDAAEQDEVAPNAEGTPEQPHHMTPEELFKMRVALIPQL